MKNGVVIEAAEGTPQGGPLSPLLANILLDELDKELEKRGHRFVRYADDCNIYVKSKRTGERVIASIRKFLQKRLKLKVNEQKRHAKEVYGLLGRDPKRFSERNNVPRSRWWWYVDEFSSFPRLLA